MATRPDPEKRRTAKRKKKKLAVPSFTQLLRKTELYRHGLTQQMIADEVERVTGHKVTRQAVGRVAEGDFRSRRIEEVYARLCHKTPEALGWPHKKEDEARARAAAARQSA